MNLLDHFVLQHVQVSLLKARLIQVSKDSGAQQAKVEMNLTPRMLETDSGDKLPSYQVSARLNCRGGPETEDDAGPRFEAQVGFEAIYQQVDGDPVDITVFSANHASLTRQLYPLLQQELRMLLVRLGLEQIHLPFDLAARVNLPEGEAVQISGSLH
jgi:hypothetical protein